MARDDAAATHALHTLTRDEKMRTMKNPPSSQQNVDTSLATAEIDAASAMAVQASSGKLPENLGDIPKIRKEIRKRQDTIAIQRACIGDLIKKRGQAERLLNDHMQRYADALIEAFKRGKADIDPATNAALDQERRGLGVFHEDMEEDAKKIALIEANLAEQEREIAFDRAAFRARSRDLYCANVESQAMQIVSEELKNPRIDDIAHFLVKLATLCAVHGTFWNPRVRREYLGKRLETVELNGKYVTMPFDYFGGHDSLVERIGLFELVKRFAPTTGIKNIPSRNCEEFAAMVREAQEFYKVEPYTEREREFEWDTYSSPCDLHNLRKFKESPETFEQYKRNEIAERLAQIDAADRELFALRSRPL